MFCHECRNTVKCLSIKKHRRGLDNRRNILDLAEYLGFGGTVGPIRDFTLCNNPLCVSDRIDTWQIIHCFYNETCPTIIIHESEKVY